MTTATPIDLRDRVPDPAKCLPCPDHCENCAWQFITSENPGYQPGEEIPKDITELPGAYQSHCGQVTPVQLSTGEVGAIRRDRYYSANPDMPAFQDYRSAMGLGAA